MAVFDGAVFDAKVFDTGVAVVVQDAPSGGYFPHPPSRKKRLKRIEEIEARIRGDVPEAVKQAIAVVVVDHFDATREAQELALIAALERQNAIYRAQYAEILRHEILEARRQDDELAILLLH